MRPYVKFAVAAVAVLVVLVIAAYAAAVFLPIGSKIITNEELAFMLDNDEIYLVDLRTADDFVNGHVPAAKNIPFGELSDRMSEIPQDKPVALTCYHGNRSALAAPRLRKAGHQVLRVKGGMPKWEGIVEKWR